ncbi:hypothetical protein THIOSC15_2340005 [uncultured Thiomicrorhabdus sp.]
MQYHASKLLSCLGGSERGDLSAIARSLLLSCLGGSELNWMRQRLCMSAS